MATLKNLQVVGKIGPVVGSTWKEVHYLKQAPQRTAPFTQGELENQYIFKLVQDWLKPINAFVREGFRNDGARVSGINAAKSALHKNGLVRAGFDSYIAPEKVMVSSGDLGLPEWMEMAVESHELRVTWDTRLDRNRDPRDRCMLLAYNPAEASAIHTLWGATRYKGEGRLPLPEEKENYHIYAAFRAGDGSRQSNSIYLGTPSG